MRPPGISCRRRRRRGPRSQEALIRRSIDTRYGVSTPSVSLKPRGGDSRESESIPPSINSCFTILHSNIRGYRSNATELKTRLLMMEVRPSIICLTETWLSLGVGRVVLPGYWWWRYCICT